MELDAEVVLGAIVVMLFEFVDANGVVKAVQPRIRYPRNILNIRCILQEKRKTQLHNSAINKKH